MSKVFSRATGWPKCFGPVLLSPSSLGRTMRCCSGRRVVTTLGLPGCHQGRGVPVAVDVEPDTQGQVAVTACPAIRNAGGMVTFTPEGKARERTFKAGWELFGCRALEPRRGCGDAGRKTGWWSASRGRLGAHRPRSSVTSQGITPAAAPSLATVVGAVGLQDGAWQACKAKT